MKLAVAGKGGVGKTTLTAWLADYLARSGQTVWMVDADTALSLGQASGLSRDQLPEPLAGRRDLIEQRIRAGGTMLNLNPDVGDLPESLFVPVPLGGPALPGCTAGEKRLLVMGGLTAAGGGCACEANALLKALLAHLVLERREWVLVDLEAGVEHLGRGTVAHADGVIVVSEPSYRGLETAAEVGRMAAGLGLEQQLLVLNRAPAAFLDEHDAAPPSSPGNPDGQNSLHRQNNLHGQDSLHGRQNLHSLPAIPGLPGIPGLPQSHVALPVVPALVARQLQTPCVLGLETGAPYRNEHAGAGPDSGSGGHAGAPTDVDAILARILAHFRPQEG
ncbi:ATP-binding protein [Desulfovibrio psychrotolerans]|uniref:Carbon monoxide dehydrogenase n=1 Tax=Desulfovibrio psychrotolerans TaxID=415242 RepID=A0A7J0BY43_9BACT|nr:carbon monoxide dehydrogenase [Desulfovibrio psychrotolerans]